MGKKLKFLTQQESFPNVYTYQITLYTLNILQLSYLYLNKAGKKIKFLKEEEEERIEGRE